MLRSHLVHWRLLGLTNVINTIPLPLQMALLVDLRPCFSARLESWALEYGDVKTDYAQLVNEHFDLVKRMRVPAGRLSGSPMSRPRLIAISKSNNICAEWALLCEARGILKGNLLKYC